MKNSNRQSKNYAFDLEDRTLEFAKRVIHALESKKPKSRYPVTIPTYAFAILKRFLPDSLFDRIKLKFA